MNLVRGVDGKLVLIATVMFFQQGSKKKKSGGGEGRATFLELPPIHTRLGLKIFFAFPRCPRRRQEGV